MSILPMYIQGYSANKISTLVNSKLHWNTELYGDCVDAQCFSDRIASQLGSLVVTNHIAEANVCNVDANGFNIKYNSGFYWAIAPEKEFLRFGPIPIPKLLEIDVYIALSGGAYETTAINAICGENVYTLLAINQPHRDGNYSYGGYSGIFVDTTGIHYSGNFGTRLLTFYTGQSVYTYKGSFDPRTFTNTCFKNNETECYISITRPTSTDNGTGLSTLSIKELKIEW